MRIIQAEETDLGEILDLQHRSYQSEAEIYHDYAIQPLVQTLPELLEEYASQLILKAVLDHRIVGSVRAYEVDGTCMVGKLIVDTDYQNKGIGTKLMNEVEESFSHCMRFELFTGHKSERNLYLYNKLGYRTFKSLVVDENLTLIYLEKYKGG